MVPKSSASASPELSEHLNTLMMDAGLSMLDELDEGLAKATDGGQQGGGGPVAELTEAQFSPSTSGGDAATAAVKAALENLSFLSGGSSELICPPKGG